MFPELYKQAYYAVVTAGNIKSGFRSCFRSCDAVQDSMMAPSLVTDQPAPPTPVETSDLENNDATYAIPEETLAGFIELSLPVSSEQQVSEDATLISDEELPSCSAWNTVGDIFGVTSSVEKKKVEKKSRSITTHRLLTSDLCI